MIRMPILTVNEGKGQLCEVDIEAREGEGRLYLDTAFYPDAHAMQAIRTALSLLGPKRDLFLRYDGQEQQCFCGHSLGLPLYLGMYAALNGFAIDPGYFATGALDEKGKILAVGGLAEKIRPILGKGKRLLLPSGQGLPIQGLQIVEVSDIEEAARAFFDKEEIDGGKQNTG